MHALLLAPLLVCAAPSSPCPGAQEAPLRVVIRAGEKTHGPGEHDHPRFLADWSDLLRERGCEVAGSLEFPTGEELAQADVLVLYAAEGASIHGDERARLDAFLARGGGLVVLHDALCGDDPQWFKTLAGGAWEHGHSKWHEGEIGLCFADREHPITRGVANFDFDDEIYWDLHLDPDAHVLANAFHTPFDVTPQMWTLERDAHRAFVSVQGHNHASFSHPQWRTLLLRGIAWAAGRDADLLVSADEAAALRYPEGGPLAPEVAHGPFELHPDFTIELVAAEPLVVNPISLDWDERGRMWVALTPGYPYKEESSGVPAHDRIAILHDDDGDGRMDRSTTFHEGLNLVTSLVHHRDGVIVSASPDILYLADTDGDDVADAVETLFTGFGYGDTHATVSNLRWGLDGWIYATQGYSGNASNDVRNEAGTSFGKVGNGLFRFRPDGSAIEMVASYGSNTWGLDFTWDHELFFTMANGSHLRHVVMPDAAIGPWRVGSASSWKHAPDHAKAFPIGDSDRPPYQQIDFVGGFTGAAGSLIYDGGTWPQEFVGDHFVCEPTINLVHRDDLAPRGTTFTAHKPREPEFLASSDLWFRPVHLRTGPDGALYVLDFYNQAAVHNDTRGPEHGPTNAAVRPDRDRLHGRIWRIDHRDARGTFDTSLADLGAEELLPSLAHPNAWQRRTAHRLIAESAAGEALLEPVFDVSHHSASPAARVHALWLLARLGGTEELFLPTLDDPDPGVRRNAVLALATLPERSQAPMELLVLVEDSDPRVQLAALTGLGPRALREDPGLVAPFVDLYTVLEDDAHRSATLALLGQVPVQAVREALAHPDGARLTEAVALLSRRAPAEDVAALVEAAAAAPDAAPALLEACLRSVQAGPLGRGGASRPSEASLSALIAHPSLDVALAALPLVDALPEGSRVEGASNLVARMRSLALDPDADLAARLRAVDALLALPEARSTGIEAAAHFLDPFFAPEVHRRAIDALGTAAVGAHAPAAIDALLDAFPTLAHAGRERAFHWILQRPRHVDRLLGRFDAGDLAWNDLGTRRIHRLENHPDPGVAERCRNFFAAYGDRGRAKDEIIAALLPEVTRPGDAENGARLFATNCGNCHAVQGEGGHVGPDLTGMGARGAAELLPFLIDPNRAVEGSYLEYVAETVDGRLFSGVLIRETADEITLASSEGDFTVPREELQDLRSTGRSPMPEGFEELGAAGLRDILAFLAAGYEDYRVLDLSLLGTSSTEALYDRERDAKPMRFLATGIVPLDGVPFEILDPERVERNAVTLRGGMAEGWGSRSYPQRVEVSVGFPLQRVHVLGGIAAWGFPYTRSRDPAVRWTWNYADGTREEVVLHDGDRFADWIRRHDVPGSVHVPLLAEGSWGQVRRFTLDPARDDVAVTSIVLESFDNHLAPTFLALTAQVRGAEDQPPIPDRAAPVPAADLLVVGGGSSHDFQRWFHLETRATLGGLDETELAWAPHDEALAAALPHARVLVMSNNRPIEDAALRAAIFGHVDAGGGLLLWHPACWYNWSDWPEFNRELVGGGSRGHGPYGEFEVRLEAPDHPVLRNLPPAFSVEDELYRFEPDPGADITVLATGHHPGRGESFPVVWTVEREGAGRILCITLGHDGATHTHPDFRTLLRNAIAWLEP